MSFNSWLYTYASPVNWTDPSGFDCTINNPYTYSTVCPPTPTTPASTATPVPPGYTPPSSGSPGSGILRVTPPAPGRPYTGPTPSYQPVQRAPGGYARDFDGYAIGVTTLATRPELANAAWARLQGLGCTAAVSYNAIIQGVETVYDFAHLQKAVFEYEGVALVSSAILNLSISGGGYQGVVHGFRSKSGVLAYSGFAVTRGAGFSAGAMGLSASAGIAYAESTTEQLQATGVRGVSLGLSASGTVGLASIVSAPFETYVAVTFYEPRGLVYNYPGRDRDERARRMVDELSGSPGGWLAAQSLVDLWGNSWQWPAQLGSTGSRRYR